MISWELRHLHYVNHLFIDTNIYKDDPSIYEEMWISIILDNSQSNKYVVSITRDYDEDCGDLDVYGIKVYEKRADTLEEAKKLAEEYINKRFIFTTTGSGVTVLSPMPLVNPPDNSNVNGGKFPHHVFNTKEELEEYIQTREDLLSSGTYSRAQREDGKWILVS